MDLTNIVITAMLALGVFSADAVMNADNINVKITLPAGYGASEVSMGNAVAENLFLNEVSDILEVPTFVAKPEVRSAGDDTVVSMVGDLLGLKDFTFVLQRAVGLEPIILNGTIVKRGDRHQFVVVSNIDARRLHRVQVAATQAPGESALMMVRRGALETMLVLEDYITTLYLVDRATRGELGPYEPSLPEPGSAGLDALVQQRIDRLPQGVAAVLTMPDVLMKKAMFTNLRGMIALQQNESERAAEFFQEAYGYRSDFSIPLLNLAFTRVHQDRYQEAIEIAKQVIANRQGLIDDKLLAAAYSVWGVAAWGLKQHDVAAQMFQQATLAYPHTTVGNYYWGWMLETLGQSQAAQARYGQARENLAYFENYAELAMLHFLLSPLDQTPLTLINVASSMPR